MSVQEYTVKLNEAHILNADEIKDPLLFSHNWDYWKYAMLQQGSFLTLR